MKTSLLLRISLWTVLLAPPLVACRADEDVTVVRQPATGSVNAFYVSNRQPLLPNPLIKLPVGAIQPEGWLGKELRLQADGFHGHLTEISRFLEKEGGAWLDPKGEGSHGWEEPPYWLKGFSNLAYILGDERMLEESKTWIEGAIRSRKPDGWFGPDRDRGGAATRLKGREDLWPNMIMLFCLQDYYEYAGDPRVIDLMTSYFRYLETIPEEKFLVGYWPKMRAGDLNMSVYWLYNRTGDPWLLDLAEKVYRKTADWTSDVINWHNVNMSQAFGQPTTFYMQSKDPTHLRASYRNFDKIRRMYGQFPGGMFAGDENCRPGFTDPRQAVETCGMVEMMLSTETLTWITGDLVWADRCEDVAFNSLPAALTADLKALRYLTAPNLVLSDRHNKSPGLQNGGPMLLMNPHAHRCCQHNWGHGWPYYAEHLWFATPDNGLAAVMFSQCQVTAKVGDGTEVTIHQETHYPFDEAVTFRIEAPKPVAFPLYVRVPGWCDAPQLIINGKAVDVDASPLHFVRIERQWSDDDTVRLTLPMKISIRRWKENHDSVSIDRGPLTYSLKIGEKYVREGGTDKWPAWEIHPTTPWNYGLMLGEDPADSLTVVRKEWPANDMPFTHAGSPIEIRAKGRRIPQWKLDRLGLVGTLQASPVKSDQPIETITLIPMGAARLRISSFPVIGDGPDAHQWTGPLRPVPRVIASEGSGDGTVPARAEGVVATFSMVAADPETGVCGAAVASKYPAVGRVVPYVRAGVGAFCTQHYHVPEWGDRALELLASGHSPQGVLDTLLNDDPEPGARQLAIINIQGQAAVHNPFAAPQRSQYWGAMTGRFYSCQGNTLTGRDVITAMARSYEETEGSLADRLMAALIAGDRAGGDHRGRLAAGIRVAKPGVDGHWLELYVDQSDDAVMDLAKEYAQLQHDAKGTSPSG